MTPRPGVDWPSASAVLAHDAQIVAAGITTVFDALSIGDVNPKGQAHAAVAEDARGHRRGRRQRRRARRPSPAPALRGQPSADVEVFRELVEHPLVQLVSVMDHAPGQRQFARLEKYREYYQGKYHLSDAGWMPSSSSR